MLATCWDPNYVYNYYQYIMYHYIQKSSEDFWKHTIIILSFEFYVFIC